MGEEAPQETNYDPRPLFERLKEQKDRKQEDWDEKFKFKNMIYKGLDEEEAGFLNMITYQQSSRESQLLQQEREEINAFKTAVSQLNAEESEKKIAQKPLLITPGPVSPTLKMSSKAPKSQSALIVGAIKRRRTSSESSADKSLSPSKTIKVVAKSPVTVKPGTSSTIDDTKKVSLGLTGLLHYDSDSDEENSNT
ncbi:PREDICTED: protein FAM192A-like isoform X2 [Amphimedon queenslandica]|uniref:FAM192A/Fyv6 N-terminal domain-containing protein n=1 Tax=Amphimedon queenslandica TaxID=400682 RepID=A0AAN0JI61_AMPQE|nr:PREDICTED: protein FAM192A-like isoform X2 [Amphimedon queenslandica]|eukprot:XP_019856664.1 PREDICTED: protein FAM192A-like isoform X2 [Amphimedon queenslandica]